MNQKEKAFPSSASSLGSQSDRPPHTLDIRAQNLPFLSHVAFVGYLVPLGRRVTNSSGQSRGCTPVGMSRVCLALMKPWV